MAMAGTAVREGQSDVHDDTNKECRTPPRTGKPNFQSSPWAEWLALSASSSSSTQAAFAASTMASSASSSSSTWASSSFSASSSSSLAASPLCSSSCSTFPWPLSLAEAMAEAAMESENEGGDDEEAIVGEEEKGQPHEVALATIEQDSEVTASSSSFCSCNNVSTTSSLAAPSSSSSTLPLVSASSSEVLSDASLNGTGKTRRGPIHLQERQDWIEPGLRQRLEWLFDDVDEEVEGNQNKCAQHLAKSSLSGAKLGTCLPPGLVAMHIAPFLHFDVPLKNQLYVIGGRNLETEALATVEMFDSWHGVWTPCPPMSRNRTGCSASCLPSGKLLVVGGYDDRGIVSGLLDSCEVFDPFLEKWSDAPPLRRSRWGHACATLNGRVYAAGGCSLRAGTLEDQANMETLNLCEAFDEGSNEWEPIAPLSTRRAGARLVNVCQRHLALVGGCEDVFGESRILQSVELFDDQSKVWTTLTTSLQAPRTTAAVASFPGRRGDIFVFGGAPARSSCELYSVEAAMTTQESRSTRPGKCRKNRLLKRKAKAPPTLPVAEGRMGCQAVCLELPATGDAYPQCRRLSVVILGGECGEDWDGPTQELTEVPVYDVKSNTWKGQFVVPPMSTARTALAVCLADGRIRGHA